MKLLKVELSRCGAASSKSVTFTTSLLADSSYVTGTKSAKALVQTSVPKINVLYSDPQFHLGEGMVHGPTIAAIRNNFAEIVKFARATPAPSPPPTPACDEPESDSDDSGVASRARSRNK